MICPHQNDQLKPLPFFNLVKRGFIRLQRDLERPLDAEVRLLAHVGHLEFAAELHFRDPVRAVGLAFTDKTEIELVAARHRLQKEGSNAGNPAGNEFHATTRQIFREFCVNSVSVGDSIRHLRFHHPQVAVLRQHPVDAHRPFPGREEIFKRAFAEIVAVDVVRRAQTVADHAATAGGKPADRGKLFFRHCRRLWENEHLRGRMLKFAVLKFRIRDEAVRQIHVVKELAPHRAGGKETVVALFDLRGVNRRLRIVDKHLRFFVERTKERRSPLDKELERVAQFLDLFRNSVVRLKNIQSVVIGDADILEAQRIAERTNFDMEMLKETGFCSGIENYSRHLAGRAQGEMPDTLIDYFKDDFLIIVDESHISIPQIRGMYAGDRSRKTTLVDYGFRLPSALDNRPLNFEEFESKIDQMLFVSATPNVYEKEHELLRVEQIIRPTGLLDPEISVRPVEGQIDDLISEVNKETAQHHKVLITTLTKRMAEDLTQYMAEVGIRVKYLHSDIDTLERAEIIRDLRLDVFDVLVGINLLREGLDIPEITLVAILDADKEGFLRSETSLIQTIGRAARNSEGHVIMYADTMTDSMKNAIAETERRRRVQQAYNEEHGITPQTIQKSVRELIAVSKKVAAEELNFEKDPESMSRKELEKLIADVQKKMQKAAADLNFEAAAELRDKMIELKTMQQNMD